MTEPRPKIVIRRSTAAPPTQPPTPGLNAPPPVVPHAQPTPAATPPVTVERPHPLTGIAKSWIALFGLVVVFGRDIAERGIGFFLEFGPLMWLIFGFVILSVVLNLVLGLIEWRTTTFVTAEDEFRIDRTFLSRESTRISYAKIQSVDIERSLPARMLGLSSVRIDVGGAGGKKLEFLSQQRAEVLRDHLLAHMRSLGPDGASTVVPNTDGAIVAPEAEAPPVLVVPPSTLLKGTIVSGFLPWLLGAIVFVGLAIWLGRGFSFTAVGGVVLGIGGYLWTQLANNWKFRLSVVPTGLHVRRGLFTTVSQSFRPDRIQAVTIHQDYLQRLTGLYRMRVTVLGLGGHEEGESHSSGTVLPYGTWDQVTQVLGTFWPGIHLADIELHEQPARARWLTPLGFKRHLWGADGQTLVTHHGWLDHTITLVPHRRVQSLGLYQGPLQRRLRLAGVHVHTTDGPANMRLYHLDPADARAFLDTEIVRAAEARTGDATYLSALPAPEAAAQIGTWEAPSAHVGEALR